MMPLPPRPPRHLNARCVDGLSVKDGDWGVIRDTPVRPEIEPLDEELVHCIHIPIREGQRIESERYLSHSLLYVPCYTTDMNAALNYKVRIRRQLRDRLVAERDWEKAILLHKASHRVWGFQAYIEQKLNPSTYPRMLRFLWDNTTVVDHKEQRAFWAKRFNVVGNPLLQRRMMTTYEAKLFDALPVIFNGYYYPLLESDLSLRMTFDSKSFVTQCVQVHKRHVAAVIVTQGGESRILVDPNTTLKNRVFSSGSGTI